MFTATMASGFHSQARSTGRMLTTPPEAEPRLRVIVETDAGGDPDDEQSLVRFLLYANEWDVEGIICNRSTARRDFRRWTTPRCRAGTSSVSATM